MKLSPEFASQFMALTLGHLGREYPHKLDHVMTGDADVLPPRVLHPIFHGSFDWHSCVHGWWQVLRLARLYPDVPEACAVREQAAAMLTAENFAIETAYLRHPSARGFSRPYGWAWALALHREMAISDASWAGHGDGFAQAIAGRFREFLPIQTYPIRVGTHFSTAFALILALEWAQTHDPEFAALLRERAIHWFGGDRGCQAWEPGGDEFLSPALTEALLMSRVLPPGEFQAWFDGFLPEAAQGRPATLFTPATVSDRSDGKIAHLDGLNLSRAWCWRHIAAALRPGHRVIESARTAAAAHLDAALPHLATDYMGEHWLASFALLALEAPA